MSRQKTTNNQYERTPKESPSEKDNSRLDFFQKGGDPAAGSPTATLLRLHPSHGTYLGKRSPLRVKLPASGILHFHGVTGGVYKTRERIHRDMLIRDY